MVIGVGGTNIGNTVPVETAGETGQPCREIPMEVDGENITMNNHNGTVGTNENEEVTAGESRQTRVSEDHSYSSSPFEVDVDTTNNSAEQVISESNTSNVTAVINEESAAGTENYYSFTNYGNSPEVDVGTTNNGTENVMSERNASNVTTVFDEESVAGTENVSEKLRANLERLVHIPWTHFYDKGKKVIVLSKMNDQYEADKRIFLYDSMTFKIVVGKIKINYEVIQKVKDERDLIQLLKDVDGIVPCQNIWTKTTESCNGYVDSARAKVCCRCQIHQLRIKRQTKRATAATLKTKKKWKAKTDQNNYLKKKVGSLKGLIERINKKYSTAEAKSTLNEKIKMLPEAQQENIRACLTAAQQSKNGIRYSQRFIYECLLLKLKSQKAYKFLRQQQLLHLPSISTINRYIRKMKATYGFNNKVLETMKLKASTMPVTDRRGVILIDEMKLSTRLTFDKHDLTFLGFVDLGQYTPEEQQTELGDHALVIMYQPFRGKYIQSVAAFLSKGAANGHVLVQLIMEAVILLENSGFLVDGVVTDAAQWNRGMWSQFGINKEQVSCEHFVDEKRRFFFFSDFPHLMKNLWTRVVAQKTQQTPDGLIRLNHWKQLIDLEAPIVMRACPRLNTSHIAPKNYEKMSVSRAYQFFSQQVSSAMRAYRNHWPDKLQDSEGTCTFIDRISKLIHALSSGTPKSALRLDGQEKETIGDFIQYLSQIEKTGQLSSSTWLGLWVTCRGALQLSEFLINECEYEYVMLRRINQDNLERFFGMVRAACGNNDHPDPFMFLLIFRILSLYSLVKPPAGCNVEGTELLASLLNAQDDINGTHNRAEWDLIKKDIGKNAQNQPQTQTTGDKMKHTTPRTMTDAEIRKNVSGYVARKAIGFNASCHECKESLVGPIPKDSLIDLRNYFGVLLGPSGPLCTLIQKIEEVITDQTEHEGQIKLNADTFFDVARELHEIPLPSIGCPEHCQDLTEYVVEFYLIARMFFTCNKFNADFAGTKKAKELRKMGKVTS